MTTTLATAILKNIDTTNAPSGLNVASLIATESERREHLRGHIVSAQWDRDRGIGILVDDAGHRQHLANALGFDPEITRYQTQFGTGFARTSNDFAGYKVTIWNLEP